MTDIAIREFVPQTSQADGDRLLPAFLAIWNHPDNLRFLSLSLRPFDEAQLRSWFAAHLDQGGRYFVATDGDDGIVGISLVKVDPTVGFEIMGLGVVPAAKRRGIGRRLVENAERVASEDGYHAVQVAVFADNAAMLCLVLNAGFVPIRIDPHIRADMADMVVLRKPLPGICQRGDKRVRRDDNGA